MAKLQNSFPKNNKTSHLIPEIENIIDHPTFKIRLIHYSDSIAELNFDLITDKRAIERITSAKSTKRKLEIYYTQVLWNSFDLNSFINYHSTGKPTLGSGFISISHSKNLVAICYSKDFDIGIDLEYFSEKLSRIKDRFINPSELSIINSSSIKDLALLWSCKEAAYKYLNLEAVFFKDCLILKEKSDNQGLIQIRHPKYTGELFLSFIVLDLHETVLTIVSSNKQVISL